uniref:Ribonuclease P protein subunit p29 n=1 Tax=Rhipicephalus microplus TaxID=6941 RepID=A0A6M2CSA0_RHIMP
MADSTYASDGAVQNVYLTTKEIKYDPPLPAQAVNYVRKFIERHAGQQARGEMADLARYTAVLEPDIARKKKDRRSRRSKLLTCREKRRLGMFNVHRDHKLSYASFVPIHLMWKDYFRGLVRDQVTEYSRLLKAEYTGCFLTVAESRCPSYVGARGFVVQETKNVFRLLTERSVVRTVPKAHSAFAFELDGRIYKIYGSHFRVHSFERMKAKFKARGVIGL